MGFSHNARKLRDRVRKEYTEETGLSDWRAPEFQRWLVERGELDKEDLPEAKVIRVTVRTEDLPEAKVIRVTVRTTRV